MLDFKKSSKELEIAILASFVLYPDYFEEYSSIPLDAFSSAENRAIFGAMLKANAKGHKITPLSVTSELSVLEREQIGGINYLYSLVSKAFTSDQMILGIKTLVDNYKRLELTTIATDLQLQIQSGASPDHIIGALDKALDVTLGTASNKHANTLQDCMIEASAYLNKPPQKPILTSGINDLDVFLSSCIGGEFVVIGARPGVGKTAFLTQLLKQIAQNGTGSILFSAEMSQLEISLRFLSQETGISMSELRSGSEFLTANDADKIVKAQTELSQLPIHIQETGSSPLPELLIHAKRLIRQKNIKVIAIDYLQLVKSGNSKPASREREIAEMSQQLKSFAQQTKCVVVALAQLNRELEKRLSKEPTLSDLRESGSIEQDANLVLLLHRDAAEAEAETKIICAKNRNGSTGSARVFFNAKSVKFDCLRAESGLKSYKSSKESESFFDDSEFM